MDLSSPKVGSDEKLALCKKYFFIGFAFLPLLWAVNAVWLVNAGSLFSGYTWWLSHL